MNSKHLGSGSEFPPLQKGKLRLYSMVFCPYAQRARLVLGFKQIPHDLINIKMKKKPEWYASINPSLQVPCLQFDNGQILTESLIICEYLDAAYPGPRLIQSDPLKHAMDKLVIEKFSRIIPLYYKLIRNEPNAEAIYKESFSVFMNNLTNDFFGGMEATFSDYMIWPWIERVEYLKKIKNFKFNLETSKKVDEYIERMLKYQAVKDLFNTPESHSLFYETFLNNEEAEYDHGV